MDQIKLLIKSQGGLGYIIKVSRPFWLLGIGRSTNTDRCGILIFILAKKPLESKVKAWEFGRISMFIKPYICLINILKLAIIT